MASYDQTVRRSVASFAALTDRGQRRSNNQDQAFAGELPGGWVLLVVADGVGGMGGGEFASAAAVQAVTAAIGVQGTIDPPAALAEAMKAANDSVRALQREKIDLRTMATTMVLALVAGDKAWVLNLGDSRAYVVGPRDAQQITEDDSWVAEQLRAGLIDADQAQKSPHQNVITKAIGIEDTVSPGQAQFIQLRPGDSLLLCSDGLYRVVSPAEIAQLVGSRTPEQAVAALVSQANAAGGPDNIAVALHRAPVPQSMLTQTRHR
jgi:protein phosphatase